MNDYIKREDALSEMAKAECGLEYEECTDCSCSYICRIRDIPSADVRENVKGKWIIKTDGFVIKRVWGVCSECGNTLDFSDVNAGRGDANFCPNCGADMRGDQT